MYMCSLQTKVIGHMLLPQEEEQIGVRQKQERRESDSLLRTCTQEMHAKGHQENSSEDSA